MAGVLYCVTDLLTVLQAMKGTYAPQTHHRLQTIVGLSSHIPRQPHCIRRQPHDIEHQLKNGYTQLGWLRAACKWKALRAAAEHAQLVSMGAHPHNILQQEEWSQIRFGRCSGHASHKMFYWIFTKNVHASLEEHTFMEKGVSSPVCFVFSQDCWPLGKKPSRQIEVPNHWQGRGWGRF